MAKRPKVTPTSDPRQVPFLSGMFANLGKDEAVRKRLTNNITMNNLSKNKDYLAAMQGLPEGYTDADVAAIMDKYGPSATPSAESLDAMFNDPFKKGSGNAGSIIKAYIGAHPVKAAAGAGLGLANISGLTDNDYYGGQLAGLAAGGLGSAFLGSGFSPMLTMAGGALGSLFDKLRQRQAENNRQSQYQY